MTEAQAAIERVIDRRTERGASDASIIAYLTHLKGVWSEAPAMTHFLDALIQGVQASPLTR